MAPIPFDLLLAQSAKITNWLTPVWLISVGISIGFLLVILVLVKIFIVSKIPGLNSVPENRNRHITLSVILGGAYVGLFVWFYSWKYGIEQTIIFPLLFVVPLSLILGWGAWILVSKRAAPEVFQLFREGFLKWLNIVCLTMLTFAILGFVLFPFNGFGIVKFVDEPVRIMNSLMRMPLAGAKVYEFEVEPNEDDSFAGKEIDVDFYGQEVLALLIDSNQRLEIAFEPILPITHVIPVPPRMSEGVPWVFAKQQDQRGVIPDTKVDKVYVVNLSEQTAQVTFISQTGPMHLQVWIIPWAAASVVFMFVFYLVFATSFPKVAAIALSTYKTELSQPLYMLLMIVGAVFILASVYIPYNTFGEDIKVLKDMGMVLIKVLCVIQAVWAASTSVSEEIEGRTALTVLSKPLRRRSFVLGKYLGIFLTVAVIFILLGTLLMLVTAYKPIYDAKENSGEQPIWQLCHFEMIGVVPGLVLAFMETAILAAVSVAISTRLPMLANFIICFTVYVVGHLTPLLVQSSVEGKTFEAVVFVAQLLSTVFPVLDHFSIEAAVAAGVPVPYEYLGWALLYTIIYGMIALLLALVLFEDRDLA